MASAGCTKAFQGRFRMAGAFEGERESCDELGNALRKQVTG